MGGAVSVMSAPTIPAHLVESHDRSGYSDNDSESGLETGCPGWDMVSCVERLNLSDTRGRRQHPRAGLSCARQNGERRSETDGVPTPRSVIDPIVNRVSNQVASLVPIAGLRIRWSFVTGLPRPSPRQKAA